MTRLPRLRRLRLSRSRRLSSVLAAGLLAAASGRAVLVPTEWEYRQSLTVAEPGLVRIEPTSASFDAAGPQQEDFRIIDEAGREMAFLLDRPPTPVPRLIRPEAFAVKLESGATRLTLDTGTDANLASVALETPHPFFLRAAAVEISDDNLQWTPLGEGRPLFRQWGAEQLSLSLGDRPARHIRITIDDRHGAPIPFTGARLYANAGPAPTAIALGARIAARGEFAGETVLTVALDARHAPLASLEVSTGDPLFMRRVTVAVREVNGDVSSERTVAEGTIYRVALDHAPPRAQLEIPLDFTPRTRELLVHIHNGDSPPLAVEGVRVTRRPVALAFMAPAAGKYALLSGNARADAPRYDLAAFAAEIRTARGATVIPGELEATPDYRPRESLGAAPLPDVPLTGAPLDASDWTRRRALHLERAGVQELELDAATLAGARTDLGDLRLLHAGNQIPYVLERTTLARALALSPIAAPDEKRPSFSIWQIRLPHAGLPLQSVVLSSASPLFQRQFRLYEKIPNANGGSRETTLSSGQWSRTPDPGAPETRTFEIQDRLRTDTIRIETDNGDNPAIALGSVRAIHPVTRLIFKTGGTDGYELAYGNPAARAPRYDLNLVAVKLLTSPRHPATIDAAAPHSDRARNPLAGLNGGYLFWGALALVVIVLLVVVARLLPKPPAAG